MTKLLTIDADPKTVKGRKKGYRTAVLYLAPADLSGYEVCPMRSKGCTAACLNTAGRAGIIKSGEHTNPIQQARIRRTVMYFEQRETFLTQLVKEITTFIKGAEREGLIPAIRLNGTSDIPWERVPVSGTDDNRRPYSDKANIMEVFPEVQFYDYTKRHNRKNLPANYYLTYSLAEDNDDRAAQAMINGLNVAAVFFKVPERFKLADYDVEVVNGDENDLRFLDPSLVIVGLKAKGKARSDTSGFVR